MLPCKKLIAGLPTHVDRPPAEKFDELVIKVYKGMNKATNKTSKKKKDQSLSRAAVMLANMKEKNLQDQEEAD